MKRLRKTVLIGGSTTLGAVMVMAALLWPRDFGPLDPPSPNGYDDFLSAAYALRGEAVDYASEAVLQALVSTNQEAYGLVSTGLTKRCVVPIQIARGYPAAHTADLARRKRLAHCLVARAELERRQGRVAEAGESYCAAYAFASRIGQGGLAVDFLVRISCEAIVLHHFRSIVSDLTAEQCSAMLRVMEQAEKAAEDWRAATERQLRWDRSVFSPRERLAPFRLRVAAAIRERSWRSLRGLGAELRPVEVRHRNQDVLLVMNRLRSAAAEPARRGSNTAESHRDFLLEILDRTLSAPWLKSAGDLNGDGRVDLLAGAAGRGGLVAYFNEFPRWRRVVIDAERKFSTDGEVADLDGDGRADVVAITLEPNAIVWYRATASGWTPQRVSTDNWHDLEVADLDEDGCPDLIGRAQKEWPAGDDNGNRLHLLWQRRVAGRIGWDKVDLPCPPGEGLLVTDVDRDGDADVVVNGLWFENQGSRRFASRRFTPESATGWRHPNAFIAAGDVNGDGRTDLVLAPSELKGQRYRISWFEQPPTAESSAWPEHVLIADIETVCHFVGVADFDRDGRADIAVAEMTQGADPDEVFLLVNRGRRDPDGWADAWEKQVLSSAGSHSMRIVDVNADGWPDLFGANWSANGQEEDVKLWRNPGGPAWEAPPAQQTAGQFWRYHWYERGLTNGNPGYESRFRVNSPEVSLHPTFGKRVEARENGLMQIRAEEDLFRITAAEFYAEVWGGHPGTANKRITVNGRSTYLLPRVGTEEGHCTYFYPSIPLKLGDLVNGYEAVQWAVDQGTTFWGHTLVDNAAIRVALTNGHPDLEKLGLASFSGRVTAELLPSGEGFKLELECPAEVAVRIASVDFQGWYEGYDENGNRQRRDWHGYSKHRLPVATLGVVPAAPFALTWDTRMLPAQHEVAVRAAVRFRADTNLVFLTAATPGLAIAPRSDAEVTWIAPQDLPDHFWSRANQLKICTLDLDLDPARIEAAELHLVTWTGGAGTVREYFKLNGVHYPVADGARHDLVYSRLPVDPRNLKRGQNRIELLSDTEHHGIEVIYPGPALVVRCRRANSGLTPSGARAFLEDGRLVRVPSWEGSSAGSWTRLARRSEAAFSGAAARPPPRRPG